MQGERSYRKRRLANLAAAAGLARRPVFVGRTQTTMTGEWEHET